MGITKYLGVNIREDLHWGNHINAIVNKGYRSLHMVMRLFRGCSKNVKERAYKSLVRPQLEYVYRASSRVGCVT